MKTPKPAVQNRSSTQALWRARMQLATDWLIDHLDDPLDLNRLAERAHLSPYHFHRVYTALMGERVFDTVRRMRLHRAAVHLVSSGHTVTAIGKKAGYGSVQAFTRAFSEAYGLAPAQYRSYTTAAHARTVALLKGSAMVTDTAADANRFSVDIVDCAPVRVVAMRHAGAYTSIGNTFQKLTAWAAGRGLMGARTGMYGIYYDDPAAKPADELASDACISVPDGFELPEPVTGMQVTHTCSGPCARMVFTGPYAELHTAYTWLYQHWLMQSGEEPGSQPPVEEYLNDPRNTAPADLQTAIYIPLQA